VLNETGSRESTVYAQDFSADGSPTRQEGPWKIDVDGMVELYEHHIIPLIIEVGVRVLSY
jgi:hypothetical protein